jgi:hypothetical protein
MALQRRHFGVLRVDEGRGGEAAALSGDLSSLTMASTFKRKSEL